METTETGWFSVLQSPDGRIMRVLGPNAQPSEKAESGAITVTGGVFTGQREWAAKLCPGKEVHEWAWVPTGRTYCR